MPSLPIKILIVDDYPTFRYGIRLLLETQSSFKVMAEAGNAKEALSHLEKTDIDLVLLNIGMPGMDGIELASQLRVRYPRLLILMLTIHEESGYIRSAKEAGADGYLVKTADLEHIFTTIRAVVAGKKVFPEISYPELVLTGRERMVLWFTSCREYDIARIAYRMGMTEAAVHTLRHNICQKLKVILPETEYRRCCPEYLEE